jgi:hypothetical protein
VLKRGALLVDPSDAGHEIRVLFYLEHCIQDARMSRHGVRRVASRQLQFVEIDAQGRARSAGYAPYLDYRPVTDEERSLLAGVLESQQWLKQDLESAAISYAARELVPQHLEGGRAAPRGAGAEGDGGGQRPPDQGNQLLGPPS